MAIRVNNDGTVVIERVLRVTKELDPLNLASFESNFNHMMCAYSAEFKTALNERLEACEEAVATAKEIHSIDECCITYTSKEGYIRAYSFRAAIDSIFENDEDAQAVINNPNFRSILDTLCK